MVGLLPVRYRAVEAVLARQCLSARQMNPAHGAGDYFSGRVLFAGSMRCLVRCVLIRVTDTFLPVTAPQPGNN